MNIMNVDYSTKIPNNVNLTEDRQVLKALEGWHPGYLDWWNDMGPEGFQESLVYLRTAVSVDPKGWAKFDYVACRNIAGASCWRRRTRRAR
jgi:benzoyl-CoA 2,3-dioxygenase component B